MKKLNPGIYVGRRFTIWIGAAWEERRSEPAFEPRQPSMSLTRTGTFGLSDMKADYESNETVGLACEVRVRCYSSNPEYNLKQLHDIVVNVLSEHFDRFEGHASGLVVGDIENSLHGVKFWARMPQKEEKT